MTVILALENVTDPENETVSMKASIENEMYTRSQKSAESGWRDSTATKP
jgi:hypothetical protein